MLAGAAVIAAILLVAGESIPRLWSMLVPSPGCELALTDGSTVRASVEEAEALTADPTTTGVDLQRPGAVTCTVPRPAGQTQEPVGEAGLTARAVTMNDAVRAAFGRLPVGGFAPKGVTSGHGARSAHYEGRAVDYFFRPVGDEQQRARGWALANWLVANAARLEVAVVIFDDRIWSAQRSAEGWRPYSNPDGGTDPISRHLDHVHADVIEGA